MFDDELSKDYVLSKEIPRLFPEMFPKSRWDWLRRNRHRNGLDAAFREIAPRTHFVHLPSLRAWLENQQRVA